MCPINSQFNDGNTLFEIIIKKNTKLTLIGVFNRELSNNVLLINNWNNLNKIEGEISKIHNNYFLNSNYIIYFSNNFTSFFLEIEGYISINFRKLIAFNDSKAIGGIINGKKILEIQIPEFKDHKYEDGCKVCVQGYICKRSNDNSIYLVH